MELKEGSFLIIEEGRVSSVPNLQRVTEEVYGEKSFTKFLYQRQKGFIKLTPSWHNKKTFDTKLKKEKIYWKLQYKKYQVKNLEHGFTVIQTFPVRKKLFMLVT